MTSQIYCPVCAAVVAAGARYCDSCGSRLSPEMPPPPEVAEAVPPPAAVFGIEYAGFFIRLLATIVDLIPLTITILLVEVVAQNIASSLVLGFLLGAVYFIGFWVAAAGATPGKMAMGIKVLRSNGEPIGPDAAIIRYLGYYVSTAILLLGHIVVGLSPQKRALHDYLAQTVVVRVR